MHEGWEPVILGYVSISDITLYFQLALDMTS